MTTYSIPSLPLPELIDSLTVHPDVGAWLTEVAREALPVVGSLCGIPICVDPLMPKDRMIIRSRCGEVTIVGIRTEP